ncbi:MAG: type VI secretion system baseplate subunit TssG, partial [Erysipelotrichaceae bacterium]|nr:type VI secretion system baseplate subunit TssG [Erysipelotrichaceae bacterium]
MTIRHQQNQNQKRIHDFLKCFGHRILLIHQSYYHAKRSLRPLHVTDNNSESYFTTMIFSMIGCSSSGIVPLLSIGLASLA